MTPTESFDLGGVLLSVVGPPWKRPFTVRLGCDDSGAGHEADHSLPRLRCRRRRGRPPARKRSAGSCSTTSCCTGRQSLSISLTPSWRRSTSKPSAWPTASGYSRPTSGTSTGCWRRLTRRSRREMRFSWGRGSRQLVGEIRQAFHLRLVAPRDWRVRRMATIEDLPLEVVAARCLQVDRARERFTKYFFGPTASMPCQYHLVVNTGRVPLDEVVALVAAIIRDDWASTAVLGTASADLDAGASWAPANPASRPRWRTVWACAVTTGRCWSKRPSGWACSKPRRRRSTKTRRESSSDSGPAASTAATSGSWASS